MVEISALSLKASIVPAPGSNPGVSLDADSISLRAAFNQDEANHRAAQYPIDDVGLIRVPPGAIGPLTTIEEVSLESSEVVAEQLFEKG
jgi:hypothetical protein